MILNIENKKIAVKNLNENIKDVVSAAVVGCKGLTVSEITEMRTNARKSNIHLKVVKNTLAKLACENTGCACLSPLFINQVLLIYSASTDPNAVAAFLKDFAKKNEKVVVKGLSIENNLFPASSLEKLADLPTKRQAISIMMSLLLSPVTSVLRVMSAPCQQLLRVLLAIKDKK